MATALKVKDTKTFTIFREECDRDYTYKQWQVMDRYVVKFDRDGHWMMMDEEHFHNTYRFIDRESPNGFSEVELNTT